MKLPETGLSFAQIQHLLAQAVCVSSDDPRLKGD
jgi:hypothetical protein